MSTSLSPETLHAAVRYLGGQRPRAFDPSLARGVVANVLAGRTTDPREALRIAARAFGLQLDIEELPLDQLLDEGVPLPAIAWSKDTNAFVAVEARRRDQLQVRTLRPGASPRWLNLEGLSKATADPATGHIALSLLRPVRPLDTLRSEPGQNRSPRSRLLALVRLESRDLWSVVIYAIGVGVLTLATPIAVQTLFNTVAFGTVLQPLVVLMVLLFAALAFSAVLKTCEAMVVEYMARRVFIRTATDFAHRIPFIRRGDSRADTAELVNRFFEVVVVEKAAVTILFDGLSATLQIIVGLVLLAVYHPMLLAFDLGLVVFLAFAIVFLGRRALFTAIRESKYKYELAAWLQDLASVDFAFRSWTGFDYANERTDTHLWDWLDARRAHFRIQLRQFGALLGVQVIASVLLLLIGGILVIERQLTLGQLVAAELVMTATVASLAKLGKLLPKVYDLLASMDKLGNVIDAPLDESGGEAVPRPTGGLSLEVIGAIEFTVAPGQRAVLHHSHADRLGIAELLVGARTADDTRVNIAGQSASELDPSDLMEHVLVLRDDELFPGTIADNITLGSLEATRARIRGALESAGTGDLADRIDLKLGRAGAPLSADERAQVLVARALIRRPGLVVIDGLFDELEESSRERCVQALDQMPEPATIVCITKRSGLSDRLGPVHTLKGS